MSDTSEETTQDPTIIGQMTQEELLQVSNWKSRASQLLDEIGRQTRHLRRLKQAKAECERGIDALAEEIDGLENAAQEYLNKVGERFGLKPGEPWQMQPDGSCRKIDPELLQRAQATLNAAAAARESEPPPQ